MLPPVAQGQLAAFTNYVSSFHRSQVYRRNTRWKKTWEFNPGRLYLVTCLYTPQSRNGNLSTTTKYMPCAVKFTNKHCSSISPHHSSDMSSAQAAASIAATNTPH